MAHYRPQNGTRSAMTSVKNRCQPAEDAPAAGNPLSMKKRAPRREDARRTEHRAYRDAVLFGAFRAALQYSTHFRTSWTASEPSGIAYSNSTDAGIFHFLSLTSWRISL